VDGQPVTRLLCVSLVSLGVIHRGIDDGGLMGGRRHIELALAHQLVLYPLHPFHTPRNLKCAFGLGRVPDRSAYVTSPSLTTTERFFASRSTGSLPSASLDTGRERSSPRSPGARRSPRSRPRLHRGSLAPPANRAIKAPMFLHT
jgi:hypothetical protein